MKYLVFIVEFVLGFPKTLYLNLRLFGIRGLVLPIISSPNVKICSLSGTVELGEFTFGVIKLGFQNVSCFDPRYPRAVFRVKGNLAFRGKAFIGQGVCLDVTGDMEVGNNFRVTANSLIVCKESIKIEEDVLVSWGVSVLDSDFHSIVLSSGELRRTSPVEIGARVWICSGAKILKGVRVGGNSVIGAGSIVASGAYLGGWLYCGNPARKVKRIDGWSY